MAVEFFYINFIVVTDQASAQYPFRNTGMSGLEVIEGSVYGVIVAVFAVRHVFRVFFRIPSLSFLAWTLVFKKSDDF